MSHAGFFFLCVFTLVNVIDLFVTEAAWWMNRTSLFGLNQNGSSLTAIERILENRSWCSFFSVFSSALINEQKHSKHVFTCM